MAIDLSAKIPNNVDLDNDPKLRRALEAWQPQYVERWKEVGPCAADAPGHRAGAVRDLDRAAAAWLDGRPLDFEYVRLD